MRSSLEIAMERAKKLGPPPSDSPFSQAFRQEETYKRRVVSGHEDKQGPCHCGYDQACTTLICDGCGRKAPHAAVAIIERDDAGLVTKFLYKRCACGTKQWAYGCEAFSVRKVS